jgi:hypothetical protein
MENNFVPYKLAVALKELGFDEPCFTTYDNEGRLRNPFDYPKSEYADNLPYIEDTKEWIYNSDLNNPANFHAAKNPTLLKFYLDNPFTAAPLWQSAFVWFRKQGIYSVIEPRTNENNEIVYCIYDGEVCAACIKIYNTYEKAQLEELKLCIKILKCKKKKS